MTVKVHFLLGKCYTSKVFPWRAARAAKASPILSCLVLVLSLSSRICGRIVQNLRNVTSAIMYDMYVILNNILDHLRSCIVLVLSGTIDASHPPAPPRYVVSAQVPRGGSGRHADDQRHQHQLWFAWRGHRISSAAGCDKVGRVGVHSICEAKAENTDTYYCLYM